VLRGTRGKLKAAARALYAKDASDSELAAWGLTPEDYAAESPIDGVGIWKANWQAVAVFRDLETQWRVGMAGPTGLDYGAIEPALRLTEVSTETWPDLFRCIRVLEREALDVMAKQNNS
jgi:hypothetical protein